MSTLVPGNTVYILGSGIPNPASYTYDYTVTAAFTSVSGDITNGFIRYAGDPATPGYTGDALGGMPCIKAPAANASIIFSLGDMLAFQCICFVAAPDATDGHPMIDLTGQEATPIISCVFDQFGYDISSFNAKTSPSTGALKFIGCEVFSSVAALGGTTQPAVSHGHPGIDCYCSNIHDCVGGGVFVVSAYSNILFTIVAKNGGYGISFNTGTGQNDSHQISAGNCTIDGNIGSGVVFLDGLNLAEIDFINCIISNHTTGGTFGMTVASGTAASNDPCRAFVDYNVFYNNTTDVNAVSYGPHDTHGGSNPYRDQSTEDYTLA